MFTEASSIRHIARRNSGTCFENATDSDSVRAVGRRVCCGAGRRFIGCIWHSRSVRSVCGDLAGWSRWSRLVGSRGVACGAGDGKSVHRRPRMHSCPALREPPWEPGSDCSTSRWI